MRRGWFLYYILWLVGLERLFCGENEGDDEIIEVKDFSEDEDEDYVYKQSRLLGSISYVGVFNNVDGKVCCQFVQVYIQVRVQLEEVFGEEKIQDLCQLLVGQVWVIGYVFFLVFLVLQSGLIFGREGRVWGEGFSIDLQRLMLLFRELAMRIVIIRSQIAMMLVMIIGMMDFMISFGRMTDMVAMFVLFLVVLQAVFRVVGG